MRMSKESTSFFSDDWRFECPKWRKKLITVPGGKKKKKKGKYIKLKKWKKERREEKEVKLSNLAEKNICAEERDYAGTQVLKKRKEKKRRKKKKKKRK